MYDLIAEYYSSIFPLDPERVNFVKSICSNKLNNILDAGCGTGELSLALAESGYMVTGIDLNDKMIIIANQKNKNKKLCVNFKNKNMLEIDKMQMFDCVLCFGNTLPHLSSLKQIKSFFNKSFESLSKNGSLIFQILNYDKIMLTKNIDFEVIKNESFEFRRKYIFNNDKKILFKILIKQLKTGKNYSDSVYLIPLYQKQLKFMLTDAGFSRIDVYSDYNKSLSDLNEYFTVYHAAKI